MEKQMLGSSCQTDMVEPLTTFVRVKDDTSPTWIICLSAFNKPE